MRDDMCNSAAMPSALFGPDAVPSLRLTAVLCLARMLLTEGRYSGALIVTFTGARAPSEWVGRTVPHGLGVAVKWTYYYLYVLLDIFSRSLGGWLLARQEAAALAKVLTSAPDHRGPCGRMSG